MLVQKGTHMGRKQYWNTEAKNKRWIKEGRGQGSGLTYKPWLTVRDVPSEGRSHRIFGHITHRTHHLLSDLELATFLLLQWGPSTLDIREQFPLERDLTRQISQRLGIDHPSYQGIDQYMSSDFVVDSSQEETSRFVLQVKTAEDFNSPRTLEKIQLERSYWDEKGIPFFLVTENQIPQTVFENINILYNYIQDESESDVIHIYFELFNKQIASSEGLKIKDLCIQLDSIYDHPPGESLYRIKQLLAQRFFHFDITKPFTELRCSDLKAEDIDVIEESLNVSS